MSNKLFTSKYLKLSILINIILYEFVIILNVRFNNLFLLKLYKFKNDTTRKKKEKNK